jgi:hypothetical protein
MQPNIALAYNSNGGIGPVGRGWSIAGLPAINRCNKTYAQDSSPTGVKLLHTDGYCLNGNRLRLTSGSYGYAGSTYQTEIADFSLISAIGAQGNGPAAFTVQGRDGLIYEYGNSTDSRVLASGTSTASVWMLNLIRDRPGNKIKFTYKTVDSGTSGTTHPVSVEWTATSHGASTYVYNMAFGYGNNTPPSTPVGYVASTAVIDDDLLTTISVSTSGNVTKKYFLGYNTSPTTGAYRLQTVTECSDSAGSDCLSPTTISYQDGTAGVATSASTTITGTNAAIRTQYDYNGDGYGDLAYQAGGTWYVAFGSSTGLSSGVSTGNYGNVWTQSVSNTIYADTSSNWCLGLPSASSTTYSATGESNITRSQIFTPDYVNCRITAQNIEPSSGNRRVDVSYGVDSFGNVSSVSVVGRTSAGAIMSTRNSIVTWGSANGSGGGTGQFPVAETNALSQTTYRTFHASFGGLATETDPNGLVVVSNQYDSFGRKVRVTRADSTSTVFTYNDCASFGCVSGDPASGLTGINKLLVIASERDSTDAQFADAWLYFDQFDRRIAESTRMITGSYNRSGRQYDAFGRIQRELVPCVWSSCSVHWITNSYDLLNRPTQQTRPHSQSVPTLAVTTLAYAGRTQSVTDPQGKVTTKVLGANGSLRRSVDHDGHQQNFSYDAAGSLRQVSDALHGTLFSATYSYGTAHGLDVVTPVSPSAALDSLDQPTKVVRGF